MAAMGLLQDIYYLPAHEKDDYSAGGKWGLGLYHGQIMYLLETKVVVKFLFSADR